MSATDIFNTAAKYTVLGTLQDPVIAKIRFTLGPWTVTPALFADVAAAVAAGNIQVICNSALDKSAYYSSDTDQIELAFMATNEVTKRALIVHECVHAGFDLNWLQGMEIAASEAAGYLAQCVFARAHLEDPKDPDFRLSGDDAEHDGVFEVGWRLAGKVLASQKLTNADYQDHLKAVLKHPKYPDGRSIAGWNGVSGYKYARRVVR